ncbi:MAG TPA: PBP1A family penicillin-binding protein [Candidatus Polarisedimenticolaceae bacterium]|nr:PBP1A family penicillin-binding protein [Candidatus Polarisedimenticolaceae bacterium]
MHPSQFPPAPGNPPPRSPDAHPPFYLRRGPYLVMAGCVLGAALAGLVFGRFVRFDLPDVRGLEDYNPPVMTRVMARDGSMIASFAEERRMLIDLPDIPQVFIQALVATEDSSFYRHPGIDVKGIVRALWSDLRHMRMKEGASTLTQQLARNLFLHPDKTIRRKLQEVVLALEIERQYTKQEILRFYCNQIYTGHGRYGIEAAARYYFGKPAREMSLVESATLAGLIQRPEALSPLRSPQRSIERRNYVLSRMADEGLLSEAAAAEAQKQPLEVAQLRRTDDPAPYFVEDVRRWLQAEYGSSSLYKEGLVVSTTLDPDLQQIANRAMDVGLRQLDRRQGWRGVTQRVPDGEDPLIWQSADWAAGIRPGEVHDGIVIDVDSERARVRVASYEGNLTRERIAWTAIARPDKLLDVGDVVRVRVESTDEQGRARLTLEQEPLAEAAIVVLEPTSGAILAMVGGFDFERSEFNRATQARRQTGSAFKPFVYAAALSEGWTLAHTLVDEPTVFLDRRNPEPYQPENYTNEYYETVTLRSALEKSANIATVKLLTEVGYSPVIDTARRLGISGDLRPYPSLALGAFEVTLLELTAAYGAFANQGVLVEPHLVRDVHNREGALVAQIEPEVRDAVRPEIAYLMNRVLSGVISDGTGRAASRLGSNVAGKTGTTDHNTDAWFVGYSPNLAVGVWVGFDEPRSLGSRETGAIAALPIWQEFMEQALPLRPAGDFPQPANISVQSVDRRTGLKANLRAGCNPVISEVFVSGTEPTTYCTDEHHIKLGFPYPFHRHALTERGALAIPSDELSRLLDTEADVFLVDGGTQLEAHTPQGASYSLALEVLPPEPPPPWPGRLDERFDRSTWVGKDGRSARVSWLRN